MIHQGQELVILFIFLGKRKKRSTFSLIFTDFPVLNLMRILRDLIEKYWNGYFYVNLSIKMITGNFINIFIDHNFQV